MGVQVLFGIKKEKGTGVLEAKVFAYKNNIGGEENFQSSLTVQLYKVEKVVL